MKTTHIVNPPVENPPTPATILHQNIIAACLHLRLIRAARPLPLMIICCLMTVLSADQYVDFTYTDDGTSLTITGYTGPGGTVIIPPNIPPGTGKPVTRIGDSAFEDCTSLTSVTIPAGVTSALDAPGAAVYAQFQSPFPRHPVRPPAFSTAFTSQLTRI